ncbi:MAG: VanW family protein [Tissierellaceae bacterium]
MEKKMFLGIWVFIAIIAMGLGMGFYVYKNVLNVDTIYKGVQIDNWDVSNKTMEQALEYIRNIKEANILEEQMNLIYDDWTYNLELKDLDFTYDYDGAVREAMKLGREGNFIQRLKSIRKIKNGINITLKSYYDDGKVNEIVAFIAEEINRNPLDAKIKISEGNIVLIDETLGERVNEQELALRISENIYLLEDINVPVEYVEPRITKAFLSRINGVIGEYSTSFKGSNNSRIENIRISAEAISDNLVLPGEEFSYNNTTGPRSIESGYKEANVIIGGELTPGLGGGVCQTSTTMYNALLLSDLTILERHPHSIPATYVPYGQDAAVSYGFLDLKFINNFDFPIFIYSEVLENKVYIYVYGDVNGKNYGIKITPHIVEVIKPETEVLFDESLLPNERIDIQSGRTGYKVFTYKSVIRDGKEVSKELITKDHYRKRNYIYKVGLE